MIKDLFKLILSKYSQVSFDFRWCLLKLFEKMRQTQSVQTEVVH